MHLNCTFNFSFSLMSDQTLNHDFFVVFGDPCDTWVRLGTSPWGVTRPMESYRELLGKAWLAGCSGDPRGEQDDQLGCPGGIPGGE